jgi:hypothetical protein
MPFAITLNDQQLSNKIDYWYYEFPSIFMLDPNRGPDTGGTHVLLKGNNFDPLYRGPVKNYNDTFCRFGALGVVPAKVLNSTKVVCISPPSFVLREVVVEITLNNQEWTQDNNIFTYYKPPFLYEIDPLMGPIEGGTRVHVHGSNFEDTGTVRCKFGEIIVPGQYENMNELLCISPKVDKPGYVPFQVSVREDEFSSEEMAQYLYYATPIIESVEPTCGPERGYTHIIIRGKNFIDPGFDEVFCVFNKTIFMNATVFEPDRIECSSPPVLNDHGVNENNVRSYDIAVTLNKKDLTDTKFQFHYYKEVTLKNITPPGGPLEGNTTVEISGKGLNQHPACNITNRFGTYQVRPTKYNDTVSEAKSPKAFLPDDVVVSHGINGQQYNPDLKINNRDPENTYTYYGRPLIVDYDPKRGPSSGGTKVKFDGFGFTPFKDEEGNEVAKPVWIRMRMKGGAESVPPKAADYIDSYTVEWTSPPAKEGNYFMEMSLNGQDYFPVPLVDNNMAYNYEYYPGPHVTELDPAFGPTDPNANVLVSVKGINFKCPKKECDHVICRFGEDDEAIYVNGKLISENEIKCMAPKYTRPDVLPVEISLMGNQYTNDGKEYGYYAPYIWKIVPDLVSRKGNTNIVLYGYGFVNTTGTSLKVRYGQLDKKLSCKDNCVVKATYLDKNHIQTKTLPYNEVVYETSKIHLGRDEFPAEATVYGGDYTDNNVSIAYFTEPLYGDPIPSSAAENGEELIRVPTDFLTPQTHPEDPVNEESTIRKKANVTCRFKSVKGHYVETTGNVGYYPLGESDTLNTLYCKSPKWELEEDAEEEIVTMDMSINGGADYSGNKKFKITKEVAIYRIFPTCGPTYGGTKMTIIGTGIQKYKNSRLRWGVINNIMLDPQEIETLVYDKDKKIGDDKFEDEVVSMNEEPGLLFEEDDKYEVMYSVSPRLPNWDRTHGGQAYLELGRDTDLQAVHSNNFKIYNYGPSHLEYYFYKQPEVKDMWPHAGTTEGGTQVIIRGGWFKYMPTYGVVPYARFKDKVVRCHFESTVRIVCLSPPSNNTETYVPVDISLNSRDFSNDSLLYHYYDPPVITDIVPKIGPESGGTEIRLLGKKFSNLSTGIEFMCRFLPVDHSAPAKYVPAVFENKTSIICRSPGGWGSGAKVYVDVTFNGFDYTDAKKEFYFYAISSAVPLSGPSDGTAGNLHIYGSGFKDPTNVYCSFDDVKYKPIEFSPTLIKCKIPRAKGGDNFFGSVPLSVSINGIDPFEFENGFHYYPQINVSDFYPRSGPGRGNGLVKFFGSGFRADFPQAKPACRFGEHVGKGVVLSNTEMLCHLPEIDAFNQTYKGEAALNEHSYIKAKSNADFSPYGIYDLDPNSGPVNGKHQIMIYGNGFTRDGKPMCRFGIPGSYATSDGVVLSRNRMLCNTPKTFEVPKMSELPLAVPLSISFFDENVNPWTGAKFQGRLLQSEIHFDPWTKSGEIYRFYLQSEIIRINPNEAKVQEIIDVYVYANPKTPFIEPIAPATPLDSEIGIKCKFGRFGTTVGVYVNKTTIICMTPHTKISPKSVIKEVVNLEVAMNGVEFASDNKNTLFTFIGTGTVLNYWPYLIGIILGILAIIGLILLLIWCWEQQKSELVQQEFQEMAASKEKKSGVKRVQPHTLRNDWGGSIPRSLFPNKDQKMGSGERRSYNSMVYPGRSDKQGGRPLESYYS